ncbi:MAG: TIGR04282 family arsenosugar biosynthesis glycosyltransferase, partial [Ktedonobacterales bacterium]
MHVLPVRALSRNLTDALVIVAKYPQAGQVKTRLGATIGYAPAADLYRAFLADLAGRFSHAAQEDAYALWWASPPGPGMLQEIVGADAVVLAQRGMDFAERLYHLAVDMQSAGYRRLVIMSSDSPHLAASLIHEAFLVIEPDHVVVGPAEDGGYYLIGFDLRAGVPDCFRGIEMSTPHVLQETLARVSSLRLRTRLLPATFDVDGSTDLKRLALELRKTSTPECPYTLAALARLGCPGLACR